MELFDRLLDSKAVKRVAVLLGILGGLLKLVSSYLTNPIVNILTSIVLSFVGLYVVIIVLRKFLPADQIHYWYWAKRYGMGYNEIQIKCYIDRDGSATVEREIKIKAFSETSEVDTFIRIPEEDPDGVLREVNNLGIIESENHNELTLSVVEHKPGSMLAVINITPPMKVREELHYKIHGYTLSKGLFGIDLGQDELTQRKNPSDYFGWHINRPTSKFVLQVHFPQNKKPGKYWKEVKYASAAGNPSDRVQITEQERINDVEFERFGNRIVLTLEVNYPLSGLVYIIGWEPIMKPY